MYFTVYSMLFLEDKLKIQELCANSQFTMLKCDCNFFWWFGPGRYSIRRDNAFSPWQIDVNEAIRQNVVAVAKHARATISFTH